RHRSEEVDGQRRRYDFKATLGKRTTDHVVEHGGRPAAVRNTRPGVEGGGTGDWRLRDRVAHQLDLANAQAAMAMAAAAAAKHGAGCRSLRFRCGWHDQVP